MKTIATLIILITTNILSHAAAFEAQDIININIKHKKDKTIINYQLNDHTFAFDAKVLTASNTIHNIQKDAEESANQQLPFLTKKLFDGLNHKQVALIIKSLQRNTADITDASKPSAQATRFVQKRNTKNLCWLADQTNRWDIRYIYHAAVNRLAEIIPCKNAPILRQLHEDISYEVAQKIDSSNLKLVIGTRLQHNIDPFKYANSCPQAIFSANGSRMLFVREYNKPPVYIYDIANKKIIGELTPPAYKEVKDAHYACNDMRILVKTSQEYPLGSLFIYDSQKLELLQTIPLADSFKKYIVHKNHITTQDRHHVTIYNDHETFQIDIIDNNKQEDYISDIWYSPDGSQICARTSDWSTHKHKLFIYSGCNRQLLTIIEDSKWIYPVYNSDSSKVFIVTKDKVLLHDTKAVYKDPQEIVHIQQNDDTKIENVRLSPDNTQLAIVTSTALLLYDIQSETFKRVKFPYRVDDYNNYQIHYSSDSPQLLLGTTDHGMLRGRKDDGVFTCNTKEDTIQLKHLLHPDSIRFFRRFNYYTPDCSLLLCWSAPHEDLYIYDVKTGKRALCQPLAKHSVSVSYSPDKAHMALSTAREGFIIRPTLSNFSFNKDVRHLQLMFKAFADWEYRKQPYAITTKKELDVYNSLDPLLQDERLFTVTSNINAQRR